MTLKIRLVVFILAGLFSVINSQGSGNDPVPVSVSFSRNPVKIGIGEKRHSETPDYPAGAVPAFSHRLKATITPVEKAGEVSFDSSNTSRATVEEVTRTVVDNKVEAILKVTGVSETPATAPAGDTDVQAKHQGSIIATTKVIVLKPTTRNNAVPDKPTNMWNSVDRGPDGTVTIFRSTVRYDVTITVFDQFGVVLDSIYNGKRVVSEHIFTETEDKGWLVMDAPDEEFITGVKVDRVQLTPRIERSGTDKEASDWEHWTKYFNGFNNAFAALYGTQLIVMGQQLKVDGFAISPDYIRIQNLKSVNYPDVPFTNEDRAKK